MTITQILFWILAALTVFSALMVVVSRNIGQGPVDRRGPKTAAAEQCELHTAMEPRMNQRCQPPAIAGRRTDAHGPDLAEATRAALRRVERERGRDSATILTWRHARAARRVLV